jgi:UDP:flavonoid glycosyltransferase YjiC (YdhE family)
LFKYFKDMQEFLDGAKVGVIYFSMGSILKAKDMDVEKVRAFADAFAELPQRVIWKWEAETMPGGQPKNVKTGAYLPQQAILGTRPNYQSS